MLVMTRPKIEEETKDAITLPLRSMQHTQYQLQEKDPEAWLTTQNLFLIIKEILPKDFMMYTFCHFFKHEAWRTIVGHGSDSQIKTLFKTLKTHAIIFPSQ